jgi:capsular polysaccharide biosynthesis protein
MPLNTIRLLRERAILTLRRWAYHGPFAKLGQSILRRAGQFPAKTLQYSEGSGERIILAGPSPYEVEIPCHVGKKARIISGDFPPLQAHIVSDAHVSVYSSGILCDDRLLLPSSVVRARDRVSTPSAGLFYLNQNISIGRLSTTKRLPEAIHIGGAGAFNWYHFILEILPKIWLCQRLPREFEGLPLLVPDECHRIPSFAEALALVANDRPIIYMKNGELFSVERLVFFDEISVGPFNMYPGHWPQAEDYGQHTSLLSEFLDEFRAMVLAGSTNGSSGDRIFLTRPGVRRDYNQDELLTLAKGHGFEPLTPEGLPLAAQARAFNAADLIIGGSGAAWVGMVFCKRPMRGLSWLPPEYSQFCSYASLARLRGHQLEFLEARPNQKFRSTGEAYNMPYSVSPIKFQRALQCFTGEGSQ